MNTDALLIERFRATLCRLLFAAQATRSSSADRGGARAQIGHELKKLEIQRKSRTSKLHSAELGALSRDEMQRYSRMISEVSCSSRRSRSTARRRNKLGPI
jgi:hypothetical protein